MVIVTWYNDKTKLVYNKYYYSILGFDFYVGYENSFGHYIIGIYALVCSTFVSIKNDRDYFRIMDSKRSKVSKKQKIIDYMIDYLLRIRK